MNFSIDPGRLHARVSSAAVPSAVSWWALCVWLVLLPVCVPARAQSPLTLEGAINAAAAQSRLVTAATAQTQAAREMAQAAGQLPDPVLKLALTNLPITGPDRYSLTRDFMTMRSVGVMQEFTRDDKRLARRQRAQRDVEAGLIAEQATAADIRRDAALAWLERSTLESTRELLQAQIAQAEQQVEAAQALHRNGKGALADVFASRGQVEQWRDRLAQTDRQIAVATTMLSRWIGSDASQPLAPRPTLVLPAWAQGSFEPHLSGHPLVAAAAQQEALADSDAALARAAKSADWSVELMFSQRGPAYSNMVSINLSVPLQWDQRQRQDRELAARLASGMQARARREDAQRAHEAEVGAMLQEWRSHEQRLTHYERALLPLAEQRSGAALAAYRAGTAALPLVLEARRSEIDLRMERLRIEAERARLWAQLNYLLIPIPAAQADTGTPGGGLATLRSGKPTEITP